MMGECRGAHAMDLMQPGAGRRVLSRADLFEDLQTSWLSEGSRNPRKLPVCESGDCHHEDVLKVRWVRFECPHRRCRLARLAAPCGTGCGSSLDQRHAASSTPGALLAGALGARGRWRLFHVLDQAEAHGCATAIASREPVAVAHQRLVR